MELAVENTVLKCTCVDGYQRGYQGFSSIPTDCGLSMEIQFQMNEQRSSSLSLMIIFEVHGSLKLAIQVGRKGFGILVYFGILAFIGKGIEYKVDEYRCRSHW